MSFGPRALAIDQGIEHRVMLHVGIVETPVFADHVVAIHRQRGDRCERQVIIACQCVGDRRVVAAFNDDAVKAHVQVVIDLKVVLGHVPFVEQLIAFHQAALERGLRDIPALSQLALIQVFDTHVDLLSGDCENVSAVWDSGGGQTGGQGGRKGWAEQAIAACVGDYGVFLGPLG